MEHYDPTDQEAIEERDAAAAAAAALTKAQEDADFKWLMKGQIGRRIVRRLLTRAGAFNTSWSGPNAAQLSFNEGTKQMGYWLLGEVVRLCPSGLQAVMQEPKNDE